MHGTVGEVICEACGAPADFDEFCGRVRANIKDLYGVDPAAPAASQAVPCGACGAAQLKPNTVLFGSPISQQFFARCAEDLGGVNLLIVAGTSLVVAPANGIVAAVPAAALRLVVNTQRVGEELGLDYDAPGGRDLFGQGPCDAVFLRLIDLLGWRDALPPLYPLLPEANRALCERTRFVVPVLLEAP